MENKNVVKEKTDFIWEQMQKTLEGLTTKRISVEQAKASANLLKQANNVLVFQLDVAKFSTSPERKETKQAMEDAGL